MMIMGRVMSDLSVGKVFKLNAGGSCTVVSFENRQNIIVEHNDEFKFLSSVEFAQLKRGTVKNPYTKSVCGVGYLGDGCYKSQYQGVVSETYQVWRGIVQRCYSRRKHLINPTYLGCTMSLDWLNFQNFAEWYEGNSFYGLGYEVDKDILVKGNKVYSAETCCLIPPIINASVVYPTPKNGSSLGVTERKGRKRSFEVYIREGGEKSYLGAYSTEEEAFGVYKKSKERYLKCLAESWRGRVSEEVYKALINWEVISP